MRGFHIAKDTPGLAGVLHIRLRRLILPATPKWRIRFRPSEDYMLPINGSKSIVN